MVIQLKTKSKMYFLQSKPTRKSPVITPFRSRAWKFTDLNKCKPVRDDVLEFFPQAIITA